MMDWRLPKSDPDNAKNAQERQKRYQALKLLADGLGYNRERQLLLSEELRARRKYEPSIWVNQISRVYDCVSDYGTSIAAPFLSLFLLWIIQSMILFGTFWSQNGGKTIEDRFEAFCEGFGLGFITIFGILGWGRLFFDKTYASLPDLVKASVVGTSILGPILVVLIGFGVRHQFRVK